MGSCALLLDSLRGPSELERYDARAKSEADVKATKQRKTEHIEH